MNQWQNDIVSISQYNGNRIATARNHVNSNLGLDGQVDITLEVNPPGSGKIKISTIIPNSYPWDGVYFNGCPVSIEAIPHEGFYFESWDENMILGATSIDQNLFLELSIDDIFTANFTQNPTAISDIQYRPELRVFPNPSDGIITLTMMGRIGVNVDLKIFNAYGKIILQTNSKKFNSKGHLTFDLSRFSKGVYFMELNDGNDTYRNKLILQ